MRRWLALAVISVALLLAACGDEDEGALPGAPEGVSDEEYLEVLCTGTQAFSNALIAQATPEALRQVIADYATRMEAITPPRDVSKFHQEYIAFLHSALEQPSILVSGKPPLPPEPARSRIARKEVTVDACKEPIYFAESES